MKSVTCLEQADEEEMNALMEELGTIQDAADTA